MTFYANVPQISVVPTGMIWIASADATAHSVLYVPCIQYIRERIKGSEVVDFYCCNVHFDDVQKSFHEQMHSLLKI